MKIYCYSVKINYYFQVVIDPNAVAQKQMNPHEVMCQAIKNFSANHLRKVYNNSIYAFII